MGVRLPRVPERRPPGNAGRLAAAFVAFLVAALVLVGTAAGGSVEDAVRYVQASQLEDGGFAEAGGSADPALTAWAVLGLRAAGASPAAAAADYLVAHESELESATGVELALMAELALGVSPEGLVARLRAFQRPSGAIGPAVNSTIWGVLALRQAGLPVPAASVRYLLTQQARSGGWSWAAGVAPDSNDTAAAIEALRAAGASGPPIRRGLAYLRSLQNRDGGFELTPGRGSDAQSTAWAIQAFLAAGVPPGRAAYAYLARLRRPDGSLRYSARYATTPAWVTAQALPALAGKPFPLR